jgi:hypothetical protein
MVVGPRLEHPLRVLDRLLGQPRDEAVLGEVQAQLETAFGIEVAQRERPLGVGLVGE